VNVEQEPAALIIDRETEVSLILDYLLLTADETALLAGCVNLIHFRVLQPAGGSGSDPATTGAP
jgi:hypothetical protein